MPVAPRYDVRQAALAATGQRSSRCGGGGSGLLPALALGLLWLAISLALPARAATPPSDRFIGRLGPLEQRLLADAADGQLDEFSLLAAALVASGVEQPEALRQYEAVYSSLTEELRHSVGCRGNLRQRAEAVFDFLHRRVLHGGYRVDCTDIRLALDQGLYNCVSATVLFQCLANEAGLPVGGLEGSAHAMTRLRLTEGTVDVETTFPAWFRAPQPPQAVTSMREISPLEMTAMIYYNRGVDLLMSKRFADALSANAKALRLDASSITARGNLLATINNWAIDLAAAGQYDEAARLLDQGMELDPRYETFAQNYEHVHNQWVDRLCQAGHFASAVDVLTGALRRQPERPYFRRALYDVYSRWESAEQ